MNNIIFGKPLKEHSEEELEKLVNNSNPEYGILALYELMRRLSLEDSRTSKRFAKWSLGIAIVAIVISIALGVVQILKIQEVKITNGTIKNEVTNSPQEKPENRDSDNNLITNSESAEERRRVSF